MKAFCAGNGQLHQFNMTEITNTLDCMHDQQIVLAKKGGLTDKQLQMRLSVGNRPVDGELAPRFVFGPGRLQRYVSRHNVYRGGVYEILTLPGPESKENLSYPF